MSINAEVLSTLDRKPLEVAKELATEMLSGMKENKSFSIARLKRDIQAARTSVEICGIMYRTLLAGEGSRVVGSKWNKI